MKLLKVLLLVVLVVIISIPLYQHKYALVTMNKPPEKKTGVIPPRDWMEHIRVKEELDKIKVRLDKIEYKLRENA